MHNTKYQQFCILTIESVTPVRIISACLAQDFTHSKMTSMDTFGNS